MLSWWIMGLSTVSPGRPEKLTFPQCNVMNRERDATVLDMETTRMILRYRLRDGSHRDTRVALFAGYLRRDGHRG